MFFSLNCDDMTKTAYRWRATLSICTACATKLGAARIAIAGYFGRAVTKCLLTTSSTIIGRVTTVSAEVSSISFTDRHWRTLTQTLSNRVRCRKSGCRAWARTHTDSSRKASHTSQSLSGSLFHSSRRFSLVSWSVLKQKPQKWKNGMVYHD